MMNRRTFIKRSSLATAAVATGFPAPLFASDKKLKIGLIGSGWYGMVIAKAALEAGGVEVIAVADVDSQHLTNSLNELASLQGSRPRGFGDYRELLEISGLEAVLIGSVTHWHALQFIAACRKGLPVYCEKPLAYDIEEGKAMMKAAREAGNIVQIGFQRRQNKVFSRAKELIAEGENWQGSPMKQDTLQPYIADTTLHNRCIASTGLPAMVRNTGHPLLPKSPKDICVRGFRERLRNWSVWWTGLIHNIDITDVPSWVAECRWPFQHRVACTPAREGQTPRHTPATMHVGEVHDRASPSLGQVRSTAVQQRIFSRTGEKGTLFCRHRLVAGCAATSSRRYEIPSPRMQEEMFSSSAR